MKPRLADRLLRALCCGGLFAVLALTGAQADTCRVAFDVGSSGVRAGSQGQAAGGRVNIDYLAPLWAGRGLAETVAPTAQAFKTLPPDGTESCARVAGGYSAWRLALETRRQETVAVLRQLQAESGVALLVIPQAVEGRYGVVGARAALGPQLNTTHILDIGGGSLQIAGERHTYGEALGQKVWHRLLCQALRNAEIEHCTLQPLSDTDLALARQLAASRLQGVARALPEPVTMTAISRPVTRGVQPAVQRLLGRAPGQALRRTDLSAAIQVLAPLTLSETEKHIMPAVDRVQTLFSDMLLVEGLLHATANEALQVSELDMTNVPGMLADDRAYAWAGRYDCYLARAERTGEAAYWSDPATCAEPATVRH